MVATWVLATGPLVLLAIGMSPDAQFYGPSRVALTGRLTALATLVTAVATTALVWLYGPLSTPLVGVHGMGFALYLDALSAVMFLLVSFIGLVVVAYSRNYLDGDSRHSLFLKRMCLTLGSVLFLIISGNLVQFAIAWIATSLSLHRLLLFYAHRQPAVLAARKKFLVSRMSDICLLAAMVLIYRQFGTLEYGSLFANAHALAGLPHTVTLLSVLLVAAACLKSAQFPLHGWLIEVMETPTPVSALLHAGIINAGGFLVLRFADVVSLSPVALEIMAIVGAITALFGSLVMLTQTSIKVSLAYSTIGQMGFMMLECGLGAFPAALLHIVGHSLYKAHAFLTSGSVIDIARASWIPGPHDQPHPARLAISVSVLIAVSLAVGSLYGATLLAKPGVFTLGAIVLLGLTHLVANAIDQRLNLYVIGRTLGLALLVSASYFGLQWATERLMTGALPVTQSLHGLLDLIIVVLVLASFSAATIFQSLFPALAARSRWQAVYVHLANGLYVNTLANRWALQLWPKRVLRTTPAAQSATINAGASK